MQIHRGSGIRVAVTEVRDAPIPSDIRWGDVHVHRMQGYRVLALGFSLLLCVIFFVATPTFFAHTVNTAIHYMKQ